MTLAQITDLVTVTDLDGNIKYVNDAVCKALGKKRDEILGKKLSVFGEDPSKGATQKEILRKTKKNGEWRGEVINKTKKHNGPARAHRVKIKL